MRPESMPAFSSSSMLIAFASALGTSSMRQASSKHITIDVSPGYLRSAIARAKFLVPGMYIVAPRQYCSSDRGVYLLKSTGGWTN